MNDIKQADGVLALCADGVKRFGTIDGYLRNTHTGHVQWGVSFPKSVNKPIPKHEFINAEDIEVIYSIGEGFGLLIDNNLYHYPCKFADYDWQLEGTDLA